METKLIEHAMVKARRKNTTCCACRAYHGTGLGCSKGFKQQTVRLPNVMNIPFYGPAEPCPRPLTNDDFMRSPRRYELEIPTTEKPCK